MEFIRFVGWIFSQLYHLLDFKILDFPISVINIMLGSLALLAFFTFLKNVTGVIGTTSSFDMLQGVRKSDNYDKKISFNFFINKRR